MHLYIKGGDETQRSWIEGFVDYVTKYLCGKRLYRVLEIDVILADDLYKEQGYFAALHPADQPGLPRKFTIEIDSKLRIYWLLQAIAHELVHVKQIARGELRILKNSHDDFSYKGKRYKYTEEDYFLFPWEMEARGMEDAIFNNWARENGIDNEWVYLPDYFVS